MAEMRNGCIQVVFTRESQLQEQEEVKMRWFKQNAGDTTKEVKKTG